MLMCNLNNPTSITCSVTDDVQEERAVIVRPSSWVSEIEGGTFLWGIVWLPTGPVSKKRGASIWPLLFPVQADPDKVRPRHVSDDCIFFDISDTGRKSGTQHLN